MTTTAIQRELRATLQSLISRTYSLEGRTIERRSTAELTLSDSAQSRVTIKGATALEPTAWALYSGHFGHWAAPITNSLRVGVPYPSGHNVKPYGA